MATNVESQNMPAEVQSKGEPKTAVETIDYGLKVRITKFSDGSQTCNVRDVTVDNSQKDPLPDMPASPQMNAPLLLLRYREQAVEAAPREAPDVKARECSVCEALTNALREQVKAATASRELSSKEQAKSTTAPQQQSRREQRFKRIGTS